VATGGLTIRNCTITGNTADGGGIYTHTTGQLTVQNSTITNNSDWGIDQYIGSTQGPISLESSIVAGNTIFDGTSYKPGDIAGKCTVFEKTSAIGAVYSGVTVADLGGTLPLGTDAKLGVLADNGGPTQTVALLPGSPCIDTGSNPDILTTDQRGAGFPRNLGGLTDMGATETADLTVTNSNDSGPH